jgi:hypothetical protein
LRLRSWKIPLRESLLRESGFAEQKRREGKQE